MGIQNNIYKSKKMMRKYFDRQEKYKGHSDSILCVLYYDELDMLITASADRTIRMN
jgi:hypothetical protein